jgi:hypothetical protein
MSRLRSEEGVTLVELMIVCAVFTLILGATLDAGLVSEKLNGQSQNRQYQSDDARIAVNRTMRELRNLARRIDTPVISRATATDFIFQTSDPSRTWVRYCLKATDTGTSLWTSSSAGALTTAMTGACPGTGWQRAGQVVDGVVNTAPGRDFPLFTYACAAGLPSTCPSTAAELSRILTVTMDLWVEADTGDPTRVTSTVFLRNQNEPPVAAGSARSLASRQVILNASGSYDPEGRNLRIMWFKTPAPTFTCDDGPPASALLWTGVTLNYTFAATEGVSGSTTSFDLVICDVGGLQARATVQATIP